MAWNGPLIDTSVGFRTADLQGKNTIVTGGGSGLGEAVVRALTNAGAFVTFSDISDERGQRLESELGKSKVQYIRSDVTKWQDQKALFKAALEKSASNYIDIVFANAGAIHPGEAFHLLEENGEPAEPQLLSLNTALIGVIYTSRFAMHYLNPKGMGCLVLTASIAGYWDHSMGPVYGAAKWGCRGLMRCLRSPAAEKGIRVNVIAPWFIRTNIAPSEIWDRIENEKKAYFAEVEDAAKAVMHFVSDDSLNGRAFAIVPRNATPSGYIDISDRDKLDIETLAQSEWMVKP